MCESTMAKISVGSLNVFNHETQDWLLYKGRLEQWFFANDINDEIDKSGAKRRAILLSSLSETTYRLIRDLALPKDVGSLEFTEVTNLLDSHFKTKKCSFAERYKFHSAVQSSGETMQEWAARLRGLAMDCGFSSGTLEETLRDRFVLGMAGSAERDRLFSEPLEGLTLNKALQLAESVRCAREGARQASAAVASAATAPTVLDVHKMAARAGAGHSTGGPRHRVDPVSTAPESSRLSEQCFVCGYFGHSGKVCRFKSAACRKCGAKGHLGRVCKKAVNYKQHFLECCSDDGEDDGKCFVFNIRSYQGEPMLESVTVDDITLRFEVDTGSAVTAISDSLYFKHFHDHPLMQSNKILQSYNGNRIDVLGVLSLPFSYKNKTKRIDVFIVKSGGPPLLGRDFMAKFNLQLCSINSCSLATETGDFEKRYPDLFSDKLGCCKGVEVKLNLKPNSIPTFIKARSVPFSLRRNLEQEIDRLEKVGIIKPVTFSDYASPIVPVLRHDGNIRLCADYSATLNKQLVIEKYPLPRIDELFTKLHGGQQFTKLDLSSAYNQLRLDNESQKLTCINTHKGLYVYTRLVFGLSSAPAIFQRTLESILAGIDGVLQFLDDILVTGKTREEHVERLHEVFRRLESAGLVLRKDKCNFFQDSVSYLGFIIDKNGLHKSTEKVKAILEAKRPENQSELKSFLGMVNYYRVFVRDASTILAPLHCLLKKNCKWQWSQEHEEAFNKIKCELASENTLAHFNADARIILTVDASPKGLSAILSQIEKNQVERPVAYVSRSLNSAEKQYSQIQKEATAIIFGVRKFHQYLYGRAEPFVLRTDHKPLLSIFRPGKGIPEVSANRLQRYALFLSAYNYTIEFVSSGNNSADFLSRSMATTASAPDSDREPVLSTADCIDRASYVNFVWDSEQSFISLDNVRRATQSDSILAQSIQYTLTGWPAKITDKALKPYFDCRYELAVEKGCLVRGSKLIIPCELRQYVTNELHRGHLGITKMKAEARTRFWWPGLSTTLEQTAATCKVCAQLRPTPARAPLTPWPYPPQPWYRVHLDFLGPFDNMMFLIAVDAYSKWVEVFEVSAGYSSKVVIEKLCDLMARFGLIHTLCTDNGPSFVSTLFENFCTQNRITHITSPPYHPASNGQAESYVKIVKKALKTFLLTGTKSSDIKIKLNEFLFNYRNSVHSSTNRSPAEVLFGRKLRCRLDLLNPLTPPPSDTALSEAVKESQCSQARFFRGKRNIDFEIGQLVLVKAHQNQKTFWAKGVIHKKLGKTAYLVKLDELDRIIKRHKNQIYELKGEESVSESSTSQAERMDRASAKATCSKDSSSLSEEINGCLPPLFITAPPAAADATYPPGELAEATATAPTLEPMTSAPEDDDFEDCQEAEPPAEPACAPEVVATAATSNSDTRPIGSMKDRSRRPRKPVNYNT